MITIKSNSELALMREAGRVLSDTLDQLEQACHPGVTTGEIDQLADRLIRKRGAIPGFLGYNGFPRSLCISVNEEVVHGIPGKREIGGCQADERRDCGRLVPLRLVIAD